MLELTLRYKGVGLARAKSKLRAAQEKLIFQAFTDYIRAMIEFIPIYSGESRASLIPAAKLVNLPVFIRPAPGVSSKVQSGISQGRADIDLSRRKKVFTIQSDVLQLTINDIMNVNERFPKFFRLKQPGPYNLSKIGEAAFLKRLEEGHFKIVAEFVSQAFDSRSGVPINVS